MTDDRTRTTHPIDDDDVARLVREVADEWTMPPVRLDQPAWRDRVRTPRARRVAGMRTWLGRLGQAATGAVVLTVAAALVAVVLVNPVPNAGKSPGPSSGRTPGPSTGARASALPKLLVEGDLPTPSRVVVQVEDGTYAVVDLAHGTIGTRIGSGQYGSQLRRAGDGTFVCLCVTTSGYAQGQYTRAIVSLNRYDADGHDLSRDTVVDVSGAPDPRDGPVPETPPHVLTWSTFSDDGTIAYVGWSARAHPVWQSGLVVVDLSSGAVLQRLALPDRSDGVDTTRVVAQAPRVVGTAGARAIVGQAWYSWAPPKALNGLYQFGSDAFGAPIESGRTLGTLRAVPAAAGCGADLVLAGSLPSGGTWLGCRRSDFRSLVVRRIDAAGATIGDSSVSIGPIEGDTAVTSRDGRSLFVWDPQALTLSRVDLDTGETTVGHGSRPSAAADGPLAALGRWLAPTAAAKVFLKSGVAISPDGSRIYALGVRGGTGHDSGGSDGVLVFDTATLEQVGGWAPTADFVSVAVSADGRWVYAAGMAGVDADGIETSQPASITVFDAGDGSIRLIAGQLGSTFISFNGTTLE